jgi:uncharacterized membrane-anchored protein
MPSLHLAAHWPGTRPAAAPAPGVHGRARVDRRTAAVVSRIRPGEIAVLDHPDLDRRSAEDLVARGVAAVVNASACVTGRYPALGAQVLVDANVPLLDAVGSQVLTACRDGRLVCVDGDLLLAGDLVLARGTAQTLDTVRASLASARTGLASQTEALTATASELLRRHSGLLLEPVPAPDLVTDIRGRPLLVVQRGPNDRAGLRSLRAWIRESRPVLIGVGAGAAVLLEGGLRPEILVGSAADLPAAALRVAKDVIVAEIPDGQPARAAVETPGRVHVFPCLAGGEYAALVLAEALDAPAVVCVGARQGLVDLLDHGADTAAVTLLGRLRAGHRLLDARAVAALHRRRISRLVLAALLLTAVAVVVAALTAAGDGRLLLDGAASAGRGGLRAVQHGWDLVHR